jgi:methyl-accepting chemotaxis protein
MTFKTRVILSFGLFVALVAALGAGLIVNSRREEAAFRAGRNALRAQFMAQEVDYFVNKKIKSVEAYVMFGEDLERYSIQEADGVLDKKFEVWERWTRDGDASGTDLAQVKSVNAGLRVVEEKVRGLMGMGSKAAAMGTVSGEYRSLAKKAREKLKEIAARKVQEAVESERSVQRVARQSHLTSGAGVLVALILGIALAAGLYNSVMLPMKVLAMWSEQIAKGHLQVTLNIPGNSEVGRIAQNFNGMVQNLAQRHQQMSQERERIVAEHERDVERERVLEEELTLRREEQQKEDVSTLEDAVEGFQEILDIMGAAPGGSKEKEK